MKTLLLLTLLSASNAFAGGEFDIPKDCEVSLENHVLDLESTHLAATGQKLASPLTSELFMSYYPHKPEVSIGVVIEEPIEGRRVTYGIKVLKKDALKCQVSFTKETRREKTACRYSRTDGPGSMTEIPGITMTEGSRLEHDGTFTELQKKQIVAFLGKDGTQGNPADLVAETDDQYLTTGEFTLPDGSKLEYFGAYGGDNPFGAFFKKGTTKQVGENSDGFVCIK